MKKYIFALALILSAGVILSATAEELVNLRYLEQQKGVTSSFCWESGEISLKKNSMEFTLFLNYPFLVYRNTVIRLDIPPFTEDGHIFIGGYTYEKIAGIIDAGGVKTAAIPAKPAATVVVSAAKDAPAPAAVIRPRPTPASAYVPPAVVTKAKETPEVILVEEAAPKTKQRKLIVLDPGHGGKDPGAIGPNGLQEKDVVLGVALRVKSYLEKQPVDVVITRDDDTFITLKNRALFANKKNADLFISVHCNASRSREAKGTRTYIYSGVASSKAAAAAAKAENRSAGAFEFLLNDLKKGADEYLSIEAAGNIQHSLVKSLALKWLPTERAPFYVLANTDMPSVLVEAAFISNYAEESKLNDTVFRDKVAKGIADGIMEYLQKIK